MSINSQCFLSYDLILKCFGCNLRRTEHIVANSTIIIKKRPLHIPCNPLFRKMAFEFTLVMYIETCLLSANSNCQIKGLEPFNPHLYETPTSSSIPHFKYSQICSFQVGGITEASMLHLQVLSNPGERRKIKLSGTLTS